MRTATFLLVAAVLCAQDAPKEITVSVDVDAAGLPVMVRAEYPGLPLGSVQELRQIKFAQQAQPYTTSITMRVPPGALTAQPPFMPVTPNPKPPEAVRVSAAVMKELAVKRVAPVYPSEAKAARVRGNVVLSVTIDKEGRVADVRGIGGHPLLLEAAQIAVAQWEYKPMIVSDQPMKVITEVEVNFALQ
jgi:TonB family protein